MYNNHAHVLYEHPPTNIDKDINISYNDNTTNTTATNEKSCNAHHLFNNTDTVINTFDNPITNAEMSCNVYHPPTNSDKDTNVNKSRYDNNTHTLPNPITNEMSNIANHPLTNTSIDVNCIHIDNDLIINEEMSYNTHHLTINTDNNINATHTTVNPKTNADMPYNAHHPPTNTCIDTNFESTCNAHDMNANVNMPHNAQHQTTNDNPNKYTTNKITIGYVNVGGLRRRSQYPEFLEYTNNHDILCMSETKCDDTIQIPGYTIFHKLRKHYIRISGGICIAIKNQLKPYIKMIVNSSDYILWIRVDKTYLNTDHDLIIGAAYIPPETSPYSSIESFDEIENEIIEHFPNENSILILGDFNAKTKKQSDLIRLDNFEKEDMAQFDDSHNDDPVTLLTANNMLPERNSQDNNNCNNYGHRLINMCKTSNFIILNGRCNGNDRGIGTTTCKDSTVVDYALLSINSLNEIYPILNINHFSCLLSDVHNSIQVELTSKKHTTQDIPPQHNLNNSTDNNTNNFNVDTTVKSKKWSKDKEMEFVTNIDNDVLKHIQTLLDDLHPTKSPNQQTVENNINEATSKIDSILTESAIKTFGSHTHKGKANHKMRNKTGKQSNWFNEKCKEARIKYHNARKKYHQTRQQTDLLVLRRTSRIYKNTLNNAIRFDRLRIQKTLMNTRTNNPREFWKTFNEGKKVTTTTTPQQIKYMSSSKITITHQQPQAQKLYQIHIQKYKTYVTYT